LEVPGSFTLGCNYWASHAGTAMWSDWRPEVVREDLRRLAARGLTTLRVFPLWPDFQPITQLRGAGGAPVEVRLGEEPLPDDEVGRAGVSREMSGRFGQFCDLARAEGLGIVVGLVTGWMSGRLFVPPALEGLDPITDAKSIAWQVRFVRALVTEHRGHPAIEAWDLGNECNCMGRAATREQAQVWTASIAHAIRAADPSRPVVSGMHGMGTPAGGGESGGNPWMIEDQADFTDVLTTHPYPYWVRHTRSDAVDTPRTTLHATAETRFYADIGGKPCFAEEIGTMGPMVAGDEVSASFARTNLFSLWANDCRGFFWWCAHDQTELAHAPYDWNGVETELGLLRKDGTAKPVLREMSDFAEFLRGLPFKALPRRRTEAVCLLTHNQDDWAVAYGSFVLAKQAGLEIEFRHIQQALPEAECYLLPSLRGPNAVPRRKWLELIGRVKAGATLYVSLGDGIVPHFNEVAGVELLTRATPRGAMEAVFGEGEARLPMTGADDLRFALRDSEAEVLATRADTGGPVCWRRRLGAGTILVYASPLEEGVTRSPGAFDDDAPAYRRVYAAFAGKGRGGRWLEANDEPTVAVTEHAQADGSRVIVMVNHGARARSLAAVPVAGAGLGEVWRGGVAAAGDDALRVEVAAFDAAVFSLRRG
jgi:hypothetical protein